MPTSKISADQISLGSSSLVTTKTEFAANELVTMVGVKVNPYDSWSIFIPGVVATGNYWFTIACGFDLRVLKIGGSCLSGSAVLDFYYTYNFSDYTQLGVSLTCGEDVESQVLSVDVPCLDSGSRSAFKVYVDSQCRGLSFFLNYYLLS